MIRRSLPALLFLVVLNLEAQSSIEIRVPGSQTKPSYLQSLLTEAFEAVHQPVHFVPMGFVPIGRREAMLADGRLTVASMGETASRDAAFLPLKVPITDHLEGMRLLLIPRGAQHAYDGVKTLDDFRRLGKVAGGGDSWAEGPVWAKNGLPYQGMTGNWRFLFSMVAAGNRGIDYLPRGANEVTLDLALHPDLVLERHLLFVYPGDHIVYLTPRHPEFQRIFEAALARARSSGIIHRLVRTWYPEVFGPALGLDQRVVLPLE